MHTGEPRYLPLTRQETVAIFIRMGRNVASVVCFFTTVMLCTALLSFSIATQKEWISPQLLTCDNAAEIPTLREPPILTYPSGDIDSTLALESSLFSFVPANMEYCQDLFPGLSRNFSAMWSEEMLRKYRDFSNATNALNYMEGFSAQLHTQALTYIHLVRAPFVKTVCETGFHAGHSTFLWLASNPNIHVFSFDAGEYDYARPMAELLSTMFAARLTLTWGDSVQTIPQFRKYNPGVTCDVIVVDGGHTATVAQSDMMNFRHMATEKNILLFDDYPSRMYNFNQTLGQVWEREKQSGNIKEIFKCSFAPDLNRGFSVGQFQLGRP